MDVLVNGCHSSMKTFRLVLSISYVPSTKANLQMNANE